MFSGNSSSHFSYQAWTCISVKHCFNFHLQQFDPNGGWKAIIASSLQPHWEHHRVTSLIFAGNPLMHQNREQCVRVLKAFCRSYFWQGWLTTLLKNLNKYFLIFPWYWNRSNFLFFESPAVQENSCGLLSFLCPFPRHHLVGSPVYLVFILRVWAWGLLPSPAHAPL